MKTTKRLLAFALAALPMANMYGQMSFDYFSERWAEYQQHTESNLKSLHRNHFKDTIKVEEMKEAFFKYKDSRSHQSPYEGQMQELRSVLPGSRDIRSSACLR